MLTRFSSKRSAQDLPTHAELAVQAAFSVMTLDQQFQIIEQAIRNEGTLCLAPEATLASETNFLRENGVKALIEICLADESPAVNQAIEKVLVAIKKQSKHDVKARKKAKDLEIDKTHYMKQLDLFIETVLKKPDIFPGRVQFLATCIRRVINSQSPNMKSSEVVKLVNIICTRYLVPRIYPRCYLQLTSGRREKEEVKKEFQSNVLKFISNPVGSMVAARNAKSKGRDSDIYTEDNVKSVATFLISVSGKSPDQEQAIRLRTLYNNLVTLLATIAWLSGHDSRERLQVLQRYSHTQATAPTPERVDRFINHILQTLIKHKNWGKLEKDPAYARKVKENDYAHYFSQGDPFKLPEKITFKQLLSSSQSFESIIHSPIMDGCLIKGEKLANQFERELLRALITKANGVRKLLSNGLYKILGAAVQFKVDILGNSSDAYTDKDGPIILKLKAMLAKAMAPKQESYRRNNIAILMSGLLKAGGNPIVKSVVNDALAASGYRWDELDVRLSEDIKRYLPNTYEVAFSTAGKIYVALVSDMSIAKIGDPFVGINNPRRTAHSFTDDAQGKDSPEIARKKDIITAIYEK